MNTTTTTFNIEEALTKIAEHYLTFAQAVEYVTTKTSKIRYQQVYQKYLQGKLEVVEIANVKYVSKESLDKWVAKRIEHFSE